MIRSSFVGCLFAAFVFKDFFHFNFPKGENQGVEIEIEIEIKYKIYNIQYNEKLYKSWDKSYN